MAQNWLIGYIDYNAADTINQTAMFQTVDRFKRHQQIQKQVCAAAVAGRFIKLFIRATTNYANAKKTARPLQKY